MDKKKPDGYQGGSTYIFTCKAIPCPPGTRGQRLNRGEEEPAPRSGWMALTGAVVAALAVGLAVGRFLIP